MAIKLPLYQEKSYYDVASYKPYHDDSSSSSSEHLPIFEDRCRLSNDSFLTYLNNRRRRYPTLLQIVVIFLAALATLYLLCHHNAFHRALNSSSSSSSSSSQLPASLGSVTYDHVPCYGARGKLLFESDDDQLHEVEIPEGITPQLGSYSDLGLKHTWSSPDGRYGPYGWDQPGNNRTNVNWEEDIDWAQLQNDCLARNRHRFESQVSVEVAGFSPARKMAYPTWPNLGMSGNNRVMSHRAPNATGRTAIVLRGWEEFHFLGQDSWSLRSIITETALEYGADYSVFLLVDIHDPKWKVFESSENYEAALDNLVPAEFRNMTVFFDYSLLEAWYPKVNDHSMKRQVWQPMQLFAHFYPEFDHYWQFEMDARFTGHAGRFLEALSTFARKEPRKQARERTSYFYSDLAYGNYSNFVAAVNSSLDGDSSFWRGMPIPDLAQIGPEPTVATAQDDDFEWGVGEDADCLLLGACHDLQASPRPSFRDFISGFILGVETPRLICPPASSRNSWNLLNAIHNAQYQRGMAIPSEGTTVSFAMWLGLKISRPPFPLYLRKEHDPTQTDMLLNGGTPEPKFQGIAHPMTIKKFDPTNRRNHGIMFDNVDPTWRPKGHQAQRSFDAWLLQSKEEPAIRPLHVGDDNVWMPNTIMHPVKTNRNGPKDPYETIVVDTATTADTDMMTHTETRQETGTTKI